MIRFLHFDVFSDIDKAVGMMMLSVTYVCLPPAAFAYLHFLAK